MSNQPQKQMEGCRHKQTGVGRCETSLRVPIECQPDDLGMQRSVDASYEERFCHARDAGLGLLNPCGVGGRALPQSAGSSPGQVRTIDRGLSRIIGLIE